MRLRSFAVAVPLVLVLAACGGGSSEEAAPEGTPTVEEAQATQETVSSNSELEPCFTVGEVGSKLSLDWELVIASRDQPDQLQYLQDMIFRVVDDFFEVRDYDLNCVGGWEIKELGKKLPPLRDDAELAQDTDEQYQEIADLGNALLEVSDDEGYEWDYKFVTDVSEISP